MLDITRLSYDELIALARFFRNWERNEEVDQVYDQITEMINALAEE